MKHSSPSASNAQPPSSVIPFTDEEKKIHTLFLSANFLENLGLTNGKIGIALYFFSRYKATNEKLYEDFAFELLEEVDRAINDQTLVGFRYGLCGIGWGIEYLVRERYIGVDEDICARFEHRIHHHILYDLYQGIGIADGLCGVFIYLLARIESSLVVPDSETMFINKRFIIHALDKLSSLLTTETITNLLQEQNNDTFGKKIPLMLSNWDYPPLLWVLGRIWLHSILKEKIELLIEQLLQPLADETLLPKEDNNRELLSRILKSLQIIDNLVIKNAITALLPKVANNTPEENHTLTDDSEGFIRFSPENCITNPENHEQDEH